MTTPSVTRLCRSSAAAAAAILLCVGGLRLFWLAGAGPLEAVRASGPDTPADLLVLGAAGLGAALLAWLGLGVTLAALSEAPGAVGRIATAAAGRVAPALVRRATAILLGTALASTASPAAHADGPAPTSILGTTISQSSAPPAPDPGFGITTRQPVADAAPDPGDAPSSPTTVSAPDPGFGVGAPTRTPVPAPASGTRTAPSLGPLGPAPHTPSPAPQVRTVTVVRGESLWAIAARHLGPTATNQQIAREWPRWYAANRAVIGPDPNLIRVGQVLTVPTPVATS